MPVTGQSARAGAKQLTFYLIFGFTQLGIDWATFVALTFTGLPIPAANVTSRLTAALVGYLLNGTFTFRSPSQPTLNRRALFRYLLLWALLTAVSTALIFFIESRSDIAVARLAKPLVEGFLAVISFVAMKFWVYR